MPLELKPDRNVITITIWGQEIEVYAKKPKASQVRKYNSAIIGKKGLRIKKLFKTRVEYGRELIEGFPPNELILEGQPVVQDSGEQWKDIIERECPQILEALGRLMLDNTSAASESDEDDDEDEEDEEDAEKGADEEKGADDLADPIRPSPGNSSG